MADIAKYLLMTAALAAVLGLLAVGYRQNQINEIQSELAAAIGQLTDDEIHHCREGFDLEDYRFETKWQPLADYYAWLLCAMGEPPFPKTLPHDGVVIRLLVVPSFDPPYMIRAQSFPFGYAVRLVELTDSIGPTTVASQKEHMLTPEQLATLETALGEISFWQLPVSNPILGLDGSFWVLEVLTNGRYHAVERWSGGELEPVGLLLAEQFGVHIY